MGVEQIDTANVLPQNFMVRQSIKNTLILARNNFVKEGNYLSGKKDNLAYRPEFDRQEYLTLDSFKDIHPEEYKEAREALDVRTRRQLETLLGERFNTRLSVTRYEIKDGQIFGENSDEPFLDVLKRGRDYRKLRGNSVDHTREGAEVDGFIETEKILCDKDTQVDTTVVSVSSPGQKGSDYEHNFYDVFALCADEKGKYIKAARYSSSLTNKEYVEKLKEIKPDLKIPDIADDVYFLSNPVKLDPNSKFVLEDRIHKHFHKDHDYMTEDDFQFIVVGCSQLTTEYTKALAENPKDEKSQLLILNAILNRADEIADRIKKKYEVSIGTVKAQKEYRVEIHPSTFAAQVLTREQMYLLGSKPVRRVNTGCGSSGGFLLSNSSSASNKVLTGPAGPFSVADFGKKETSQEINNISEARIIKCKCPVCGAENVKARIADGRITCPECNASANYEC